MLNSYLIYLKSPTITQSFFSWPIPAGRVCWLRSHKNVRKFEWVGVEEEGSQGAKVITGYKKLQRSFCRFFSFSWLSVFTSSLNHRNLIATNFLALKKKGSWTPTPQYLFVMSSQSCFAWMIILAIGFFSCGAQVMQWWELLLLSCGDQFDMDSFMSHLPLIIWGGIPLSYLT